MNRAPTGVQLLLKCPQCSKKPSDQHKQFGYCTECRTHTLIVTGGQSHTYEPMVIGEGGIFRCCTEPTNAWALLNPSPWADGTEMPCMYHGLKSSRGYTHGLVYRAENNRWYARKPTAES